MNATIAIPLIFAGIGILAAPDLRDLVLHLLDKEFQTQLDFRQSEATGWILLGCGLCVYSIERLTWSFGGQPIFALRHQSFLPLPPTLTRKDLPPRFAMKRVRSIDCDLFALMNANPKKVEASLLTPVSARKFAVRGSQIALEGSHKLTLRELADQYFQ